MGRDKIRDGRIAVDATDSVFGSNPFDELSRDGLRDSPPSSREPAQETKILSQSGIGRGCRLDVRREKAGRGGKTVTTVAGFPPYISRVEHKGMLRELKKYLGSGGTFVEGDWELQGDQREKVVAWLCQKGFQPVLAGG